MEYCNELKHKISVLCDYIDRMDTESEDIPLIDRDILMGKIRSIYEYVYNIPVNNGKAYSMTDENIEKIVPAQDSVNGDSIKNDNVEMSKSLLSNASIFAPDENHDKVEAVADPIMKDAENKDYEALFDSEPNADTEPFIDNNATSQQEDPTPQIEEQSAPLQQPEHQEEEPTTETIEPEPEPEPEPQPEPESEPNTNSFEERLESPTSQELPSTDNEQDNPKPAPKEPSLFDYLSKSQESKLTQTIGDKFEQEHASIVDHISQQTTTHKVSDLRTVININEKFSFVGALFHNNMRAYTDFILRLNAIDSRTKALDYISEIAQQYNWDMDSLEVKTFNKILDRKF